MDVGIYLDLRNPPGWRQDWSRLYGFTLEAIEEAERLGARSVWLSEHHLFEDGYLNQPLTYAAAAAARTRTIRIGTAVVIAPFWNPVQLAEEAVVVDLISNGRLDLGVGAGYRLPEYELYGKDFSRRYRDTDRAVVRMREIWNDPRHLPGPVQDPLPVWMGYSGPQGATRAGRMGEGLLSIDPALYSFYAAGLAEGGHGLESARMKGPMFGYVTEDPERDWPVVSKHYAYQADSYRAMGVEGTGMPHPPAVDPDLVRARGLSVGLSRMAYGTPEQIAADLKEYLAGAPVTEVFFWVTLAGLPEEMVMKQIRTVCSRLRPLLEVET